MDIDFTSPNVYKAGCEATQSPRSIIKARKAWRRGMHIGYWWESQKERDHWEDQDVGGWTILKWILER
jgi:hypothetical protein